MPTLPRRPFNWQLLWLPALLLLGGSAWMGQPPAGTVSARYYWPEMLNNVLLLAFLAGLLSAVLALAVWRRLPYLARVARLFPLLLLVAAVALVGTGLAAWLPG